MLELTYNVSTRTKNFSECIYVVLYHCADMFHHDCYHDGCSSGSVLGDLRSISRHSGPAQSALLLPTVARLCRHSHCIAHRSVSVMCRHSTSSLLGSVSVCINLIIISISIHRVGHFYVALILCQLLTNFKNSFTGTFCGQFAIT